MPTSSRLLRGGVLTALCMVATQVSGQELPYQIVGGKPDITTLRGWQTYRAENCGLCHGESGEAPAPFDLVNLLKSMPKLQFVNSVLNGKALMPPYRTYKSVSDNIDGLYAYLKARADGALAAGKPEPH